MLINNRLRKVFRPVLKEYHQSRYWGNLARSMKTHNKKQNLMSPYQKPGIALSFDDSFRIEHWYKYAKDMFGYYDIKVTFNINAFHHFENQREHSQKEIDLLLDLQANGHEIAHHGFKHRRAVKYVNECGLRSWIEDEIKSLFQWMEKQSHSRTNEKFKKPVSYAFPHFIYNESLIEALVPKYFKIIRGRYHNDNLTQYNHTGLAPSICIDRHILMKPKYIKKIMGLAKQSGKNLILTCHSILPDELDWDGFGWGSEAVHAGNWRISPKTLQMIIQEARELDMPFYTTSEIAGVAAFIDPNFEKCVREKLRNPYDQWISIDELSLINELDISNRGISNLDGIQYFSNLERLNLKNNNVSDTRLLDKLPKLNRVNIRKNQANKERLSI